MSNRKTGGAEGGSGEGGGGGLGALLRARARERARGHPLLRSGYAYVERPNATLLRVIPEGASVLDVGCGGGLNLAALVSGGRHGAGLEIDEGAAERGRRRGLTIYSGDVRDGAVREKIFAEQGMFDVVLFADVLEHFESPEEIISSSLPLLAAGGKIVISIPNVAVWYQRLALAFGQWNYDETGILDRTHLRFFTKKSFRWWLETQRLRPLRWSVTPSLVASVGRFLRPLAKERGDGMEEAFRGPFRFYSKWIEPAEYRICSVWPSLLAFQLVVVAERQD